MQDLDFLTNRIGVRVASGLLTLMMLAPLNASHAAPAPASTSDQASDHPFVRHHDPAANPPRPIPAPACELQKLVLAQHGAEWSAQVGPAKIVFTVREGPKETPLHLVSAKVFYKLEPRASASKKYPAPKACALEIDDEGRTPAVFVNSAKNQIFIPKLYGTSARLETFDLLTCKKTDLNFEGAAVEIEHDSISVPAHCERINATGDCSCTSAVVYKLNVECRPITDDTLSRQLTRTQLGFELKTHAEPQPSRDAAATEAVSNEPASATVRCDLLKDSKLNPSRTK